MTEISDQSRLGTEARRLMRRTGFAALGTNFAGSPYVSLVAVASDHDASPLMMLSNLAQHTRNFAADPRVSLLCDGTRDLPDPLAGPRLTLLGRIEPCGDASARARFVARHPDSAPYAGFADFRLYRVAVERGHFVAGFGRISWVEAAELRFPAEAGALAAAEPDIVNHMNADHADAVALFAERLLHKSGSGWNLTGIDPEGIDLRSGHETARLDFAEPVLNAAAARSALVALTRDARAIDAGQPSGPK
jgi:putative heme iron utilization protein